ncbi:MAG: hypothetical protein JXR76_22060 [Deltaproteobacteria bacterium]|nr:hypothetical protein [Deltaproteobacteria bacterium]
MTQSYSDRVNKLRAYFASECAALMRMRVGIAEKKQSRVRFSVDERMQYQMQFLKKCLALKTDAKAMLIQRVLPLRSTDPFEESDAYIEALLSWLTEHHINVPWARGAISTYLLNLKRGNPEKYAMVLSGAVPMMPKEPPFSFSAPDWDPVSDGEGLQLKGLCNVLTDRFFTYLEKNADLQAQEGLRYLPETRERANTPDDRVEWLVRRVVFRWSAVKIAREYNVGGHENMQNAAQYVRRETNRLSVIVDIEIPPYDRVEGT